MTLLTVAQVAGRLHCSADDVRKLLAGRVPGLPRLRGIRLHRWLVPKDALAEWLSSAGEGSAEPKRSRFGSERNGHGSGGK